MILGSQMVLSFTISEFIALVHKSPTHRTTLAHFQHPQTLMSSSESQCVRARCAIRHLGATKGNRADTASIISSLHAENDVMIVAPETRSRARTPNHKNPADPTTISFQVHHAVSTALVFGDPRTAGGVTRIELVVRGIPSS